MSTLHHPDICPNKADIDTLSRRLTLTLFACVVALLLGMAMIAVFYTKNVMVLTEIKTETGYIVGQLETQRAFNQAIENKVTGIDTRVTKLEVVVSGNIIK